ncbi:hypothetical protein [Rhizobium sp. CF142]|uniref:hypothetical protein n=1 Tax=Rhizobium sp. CF142 TaxID=1144314 RepID=UPI00026F02DB|nr:hypothetical protein [Rhizobium sp. CF142]EJJ27322.1 hypothetical protein PMI11_04336 [Rhizobium sp. CF142]
MKNISRDGSSAADHESRTSFVHSFEKPITAKRIERALNRLSEIIVTLGEEGERAILIYERLETELAARRAREQRIAEISERAKRAKASRAMNGGKLMDDSFPESAREQIDEAIAFHEANIEAIEAGRLRHQFKAGDEPWRDMTDQFLNHHKRSKELHQRLRKLVDESRDH